MITSPYNFVPLSDNVVSPFWVEYVSHDVPFKDSQSGTLKLKIKAESPIYVRNGVPGDAPDNDKKAFNHFRNEYFIPGSSIRGMLRSVMEIMSFGRMGNKVNNDKYSVRDFQNNHIYPKTELSNHIECGWLYKIGEEYFLDKCGKPGRITSKNIDDEYGTKMKEFFSENENLKESIIIDDQKISAKAARFKYEKFSLGNLKRAFISDYETAGRLVYKIDKTGDKIGIIVLTGQPGERYFDKRENKWKGKHLEFIFWETEPTRTQVPDEVIKNFFFAYYDHDKNSQKEDWKWRKRQLDNGEKIPVFYRSEKGELIDMGLTMLFKITYKNSVLDSIKKTQKNADSYDLAETIFGYTDKEDISLKGRIHVGHAFVSNGLVTTLSEKLEVLAEPKASYYPNYIEQSPEDNGTTEAYGTFMDAEPKIRGWKRYPIHSGDVPPPETKGRVNEKVATKFIPLPKGTEFIFDIHYHNLRKEELGALISAITFHNTDGLFHSLGSAKPLGYGKITLTIENGLPKKDQVTMMEAYESYMDCALNHSTPLWHQSLQIKELFAMAKPGDDDKLKYMTLPEFANKKGRGQNDYHYALQKYSVISGNNFCPASLITKDGLNKAKVIYNKEKEGFTQLKKIEEVKQLLLSSREKELSERIDNFKNILLKKLEKRKEDQIKMEKNQEEIKQGINLNGVSKNKSIYGLSRALKYWKNLGGAIDTNVYNAIITRFTEIHLSLKMKEIEKWVQNVCENTDELRDYLTGKQIEDLKRVISSFTRPK